MLADSDQKPARPERPTRGTAGYLPLSKGGRICLAAVVAAALGTNALAAIDQPARLGEELADSAGLVALGLFAWRPPMAALALAACAAATVAAGRAEPYLLILALASGLVTRTCGRVLWAGHGLVLLALAIAVETSGTASVSGGGVTAAAVALTCGAIGWGFRAARERELRLAGNVEALAQEAARVRQLERDRIADELHNIIAHDITIVVMQARALELTTDAGARTASTAAIAESASQALTDIRRMLRIVQAPDVAGSAVESAPRSLPDALSAITAELSLAGIGVGLLVPDPVPTLSAAVETTLVHVAREAATNVMKHAPDTPAVRLSLAREGSHVILTCWNAPSPAPRGTPGSDPGFGLTRMRDRVELLGGVLTVTQEPEGWTLRVRLPRS